MIYFADLHIHVGINEEGRWVKVPSSKTLTVRNILKTAREQKGLDIIGIIDALSPLVQKDLECLLHEGELQELPGGGYLCRNGLVVLLGGEVETREISGGLAHSLLFLPTLQEIKRLSQELSRHISNINISSQNAHMSLQDLYALATRYQAKIVPAHVFTPFKSVYGNCTDRMAKLFDGKLPELAAIELGLSSDAHMADRIDELKGLPFLANSDAHSLPNIAREFSEIEIAGPVDFTNIFAAIKGINGCIKNLYGFNPALGKYYTTRCAVCDAQAQFGTKKCNLCNGRVISGVKERIDAIADHANPRNKNTRAGYVYHLPLMKIPGFGPKTLAKINYTKFTELDIIYRTSVKDLEKLLGTRLTQNILKIRNQNFAIKSGGAGQYGYVIIQ